jgi:hypothetical protein
MPLQVQRGCGGIAETNFQSWYGLDGQRIESWWVRDFSAPAHTGCETHTASCETHTGCETHTASCAKGTGTPSLG